MFAEINNSTTMGGLVPLQLFDAYIGTIKEPGDKAKNGLTFSEIC